MQTIASGLVFPWSLAILPSGEMLVTEKPGRLRLVANGKLASMAISGVPQVVHLLDVVAHPKFGKTRWIYLSCVRLEEEGHTKPVAGLEVIRARFDGTRLTDVSIIFRVHPKRSNLMHYGGRMIFLRDETLLVTVGDGSTHGVAAQDFSSHLGSVVRINEDGSVPLDNPFVSDPDALPEILTKGHRNSQGIARGRDGEIWATEHGPIGGDELNLLVPGANFGWPYRTSSMAAGFREYRQHGALPANEPAFTWTPAIAPSGIVFYEGSVFPDWKGDLLIGSMLRRGVVRVRLAGNRVVGEETILQEIGERVRDVRSDPRGYLYVLTDSLNGKILRLAPAPP